MYVLIFILIPKKSLYNENNTFFDLVITKIRYKNNQTIVEFDGKEKLLSYYNESFNYQVGDRVVIKGYLTKPSNNTIPNAFNYRHYLYHNGINYLLNIEEITLKSFNNNLLYKIKNKIIRRIEKFNHKDYLYAFILGETYYLDSDIKDSYQYNGISHLLAIGSMHITIIIFVISFILHKLKINDYLLFGILIIAMGFYIVLTDYSISIIRSVLTYILVFFNRKLKLEIKYVNIAILVLIINLLISPFNIYNLGFQYSYLISYFLIKYSCLIKGNYFKKSIIISLMALLVSFPITILNNYEINFLSVLLNLFFVPVINFIVCPLCFIVIILPELEKVLELVILLVENISKFFSNINIFRLVMAKPSILVVILYYFLIVIALRRIKIGKYEMVVILMIIILVHSNINYFLPRSFMTVLDVKQGDAIVMHINNQTMLIDTGGSTISNYASKIENYLKSEGISKIDYLFITHGDYDHIGSAYELVNNFVIKYVCFNGNEYNNNELKLISMLENKKIRYRKIEKLTKFKLGKKDIYAVSYNFQEENDASIVLVTSINNHKVLLMGDASKKTEIELLDKFSIGKVDILKVGHHGSDTSTSESLLNEIKPSNSLISVGKNNLYHHPSNKVIERLKDTIIWQTSINGSIYINFKEYGTFKTYVP